uniref:T9SS type A sorting domain-containing protein n=1 Tax=Flavobacterium sp. TaxID=239 RepID=UPI0040490E2E
MKQKLLFLATLLVFSFSTQAQVISLLGDFSGWSDVNMMTEDNENYTLENVAIEANGNAKFRQDGSWDVNWGSSDFPTGTGTQGGSDIPVLAGLYNVSINIVTGLYAFETVETDFDNIGFIGAFNDWSESVALNTIDGAVYTFKDFYFSAENVKFRKDNAWEDSWGGTTFPAGDAVYNGGDIPLTTGYYNVTFDLANLTYDFEATPITMIGPAVSDWNTDVAMTTADGGKTFTSNGVVLVSGELKFRVNNAWTLNYGGSTFPAGQATPNSESETAIPVEAGTYDITFDRVSSTYTFITTLSNPNNVLSDVKVFPNPSNDNWNFQFGTSAVNSIQLTDFTGKVILRVDNVTSSYSIDASALNSGMYFAVISSENAQKTFKLVKN